MKQSSITLEWQELSQLDELAMTDKQLVVLAAESLENAYAPYSKFKVGAAVLLANGKMLGGSNQENAAYPMCLCAERVALASAASQYPNIIITSIAVTIKARDKIIDKPAMPCGSCRQALCEVENKQRHPIRLIVRGEVGTIYVFRSVKDILPFSFDGSYL